MIRRVLAQSTRDMRQSVKGMYTHDCVAFPNAHLVPQLVKRLHILLATFAHGDVFDDEALVPPCLHSLDVELGVFGGDVQYGCAAAERQPAIAVGKELLRHIVVQRRCRKGRRAHAMAAAGPL